jgi:type I restriction enzyme M protein
MGIYMAKSKSPKNTKQSTLTDQKIENEKKPSRIQKPKNDQKIETGKKQSRNRKPQNSEVDAYAFIKEYLRFQGWDIKNPNRNLSGQVYTQNECLDHPEIKKYLSLKRPENIVKISESEYYIIEAKRERNQIDKALREAENDYAREINKSRLIKSKIISGVAGNSTDDFVVKSKYYKDGEFHPILINGKEITGFVSPLIARILLESDSPEIEDLPVDETVFLRAAEDINTILHIGAINKNSRARVIATLLLSMIDDTRPNVNSEPNVFFDEINSRAKNVLMRNGKLAFYNHIKIELAPSLDSHLKNKNALVKTIMELEHLNIRSAMNSGTDVLGKFYEIFLKYGNGAKEIGIVLTPRHVTKFAAEVLDVNHNDIVYDPTSGTGGFLVASFDRAKTTSETKDEIDYFKENGLYGVESEPEVAALAIVNMIFRGDGKNNIIDGNCLVKSLIAHDIGGQQSAKFYDNNKLPVVRTEAVTKVLMNPPFALKDQDEKEFTFIKHALKQMKDGKLLFSILPRSVLVKQGKYRDWRKNLLEENTLLSVINFPEDLFYPVGVQTDSVPKSSDFCIS